MDRRAFVIGLAGVAAVPLALGGWLRSGPDPATGIAADTTAGGSWPPLHKSPEDWKKLLSADAYNVLFREYTERPFSSPLDEQYDPGTYVCAACFLPLFSSDTKFDSGTGWPSFYRPLEGRLATKTDHRLAVPRTEYHCIRCGGHQGHVFRDGPPPTGLRYCNNGLALRFVPEGEELPALRT